jgi:hypothetical protein
MGVKPGRTQVEHIESTSPPKRGHEADMPGQTLGVDSVEKILAAVGPCSLRAAGAVLPSNMADHINKILQRLSSLLEKRDLKRNQKRAARGDRRRGRALQQRDLARKQKALPVGLRARLRI